MAKLRFIKEHNEYQIDYRQNGKRIRCYLGPDKKNAEKELKRVEAFLKAKKLGFQLQTPPTAVYTATLPVPSSSTAPGPHPDPDKKRIKIDAAIDLYLKRCKEAVQSGNMIEKTYEYKESLFRDRFSGFLKKKFPHLQDLEEIEKMHIESYRAYRMNSRHKFTPHKKIKPASVNNDLRDLVAFFNYCIDNRNTFQIMLNPASKVKKIQKSDRDERPPCLSPEQIKQVLKMCNGDIEFRNVIETFLETGLRYNELRNLRWQDIDLEKGFLTVKSREEFHTKSRKSRTIPLSQRMRKLLQEIPKRTDRLFDLNNIQRIKAKKDNLCNIRKRFDKIKAKLPFLRTGDRFHIFRHTALTRWANSGVPLPIVQKWAGHSSVEMTMKYVHPSDEESSKWMKKFSNYNG